MTDRARLISTATPTSQPVIAPIETPLVVTGGVPVTVLVGVAKIDDTQRHVYFRLPGDDTRHGSILWKCGGYALMVTFVFDDQSDFKLKELLPVTPAFWFSDKFTPTTDGPLHQGCCLQSLPGSYHFDVVYDDVLLGNVRLSTIDPQIVVTPQ
ncbi:MAG: hypothetical protein LAP87_31240 [Acidobacteriia bacterium]|nr:hypothetical protein [Terriglobia bacterium]